MIMMIDIPDRRCSWETVGRYPSGYATTPRFSSPVPAHLRLNPSPGFHPSHVPSPMHI